MLETGARPLVTLYHWDLPQALEDQGGWPNRETADRLADYADIVAGALGDRIDHWAVFNEANVFTSLGYLSGIHAPGRKDPLAYVRATHTVNPGRRRRLPRHQGRAAPRRRWARWWTCRR